jgi:hypothetical protein
MEKKYIVCDSGSLISLTSSCLLNTLYFFKNKYNITFAIPPAVEEEVVSYPLRKGIKKFMYSAIVVRDAIADEVIEVIQLDNAEKERERVLSMANNLLFARGRPLTLIQLGETEMLILAKEIGAENVMLDERTMRMLIEAPFRLKEHMEMEFGVNLMVNRNNFNDFTKYAAGLKAMRSSEIVMLAYESGFFKKLHGSERENLEGALYKIKFSGCSLGFDEISTYLKAV